MLLHGQTSTFHELLLLLSQQNDLTGGISESINVSGSSSSSSSFTHL